MEGSLGELRRELNASLVKLNELWRWCSPDTDMDAYDVWNEVFLHIQKCREMVGLKPRIVQGE